MTEKSFSGKLLVRMDPDLHAHLAALAATKGISLNALITTYLAGASSFKRQK